MSSVRQAGNPRIPWFRHHEAPARSFTFERLEAYQRALQLAEAICGIADGMEPSRPSDVVTSDHLRCAALAVLSLAEGADDHHRAWKCLEQARIALCRCVALLQLFAAQGRVDTDLYAWCYEECLALSEMLDRLIAEAEPYGAPRAIGR